jgi:hypothetical protein
VGVNLRLNPRHVLRAAYQRHLVTHSLLSPSLVPTETAGFPWLTLIANGAILTDAGVKWEAEWDPKTFSVLQLTAQRFDLHDFTADGNPTWSGWRRYQASFTANRILNAYLGLSAGVAAKRVVRDSDPALTNPPVPLRIQDYFETRTFLGLAFLHKTGWQGAVTTNLLTQHLRDRSDNLFGLVDVRFGKELANKRGLVSLEVTNLTNRRFFQALERFREFEPDFSPSRRILFKLALYY